MVQGAPGNFAPKGHILRIALLIISLVTLSACGVPFVPLI